MVVFRFLYLNVFAFLLIGLGIILFFLPQDIFIIIIKIILIISPIGSGIGILCQWKAKNRKLNILIAKNKKGIRLDTFLIIRETPCGWLIVNSALSELRKMDNHKTFTKEEWEDIRRTVLGRKKKNCNIAL